MARVTLIALVSLLVLAFVGVALFVLWGVTFWTGLAAAPRPAARIRQRKIVCGGAIRRSTTSP
jgi:hypothetical protein